jgi:hypothetical protein
MFDPFDQTRKANDVNIIITIVIRNTEAETLDGTGISGEQNRVHKVIKANKFFFFVEIITCLFPEVDNKN